MRQRRTAQISIFENYAKHETGIQLQKLSLLLDENTLILDMVEQDLIDDDCHATGCRGLTVESVFRCLLLKQKLQVSYDKLSFLLCDSQSYRTFARLKHDQFPGKSSLQQSIRRIRPETLERVHQEITKS